VTRILGIDFSGASDAGSKIWIAEGRKTGHPFELTSCIPARSLPGGGNAAAAAIAALRRHIQSEPASIVGCDFPFSLPAGQVQAEDWRGFVMGFAARFPDPAAFYAICHREADGVEVKRRTDIEHRTPFNAYNLRIYRQTWWGLAHLLAPLVVARSVAVYPQQRPRPDRPVLIEICPACSLKRIGFYPSYKGRAPQHRKARKAVMEHLIALDLLAPPPSTLANLLLDNAGGDALDAVIGAVAANRADLGARADRLERLEGRVFT
jgi:hypothetical protein